MLTPKGKRRKASLKPPYHTYASGIGNKAIEYAGEVFVNRWDWHTGIASVAKFNADALPVETVITEVTPTVALDTPNESYGWTLTKLTAGIFSICLLYTSDAADE